MSQSNAWQAQRRESLQVDMMYSCALTILAVIWVFSRGQYSGLCTSRHHGASIDLMSQAYSPLRELRLHLISSRLGCSADQNKGAQLHQKVTNSFSSKCRTLTRTKSMACTLWLGLAPVCLVPFLISTVRWSYCLLSWPLLTATLHPGMIKWPACWQADLGQSPRSTDVRPILFLATSGQSLWVCHQTGQVNRRKAVI